ncbi:hypothetical protein ACLB2K_042911 [Fragaria x ananassa]
MKTKKRVLVAVSALCLFFIVFQISVSSTSRFLNNAAFPAKTRETTRKESKLISEQIHHPPESLSLPLESPIICFDVVVFEPKTKTSLQESYALLNSSHAFVGVHGAALTHSLFLRPGAVFVQVVPIGIGWAAEAFFGRVAKELSLEYFEYKIGAEESSLVEKYGKDNLLVRDPFALLKTGWPTEVMYIYLKEQNVKLDLVRFKRYLKKAFNRAKRFMENEGE